MHAWPGSACAAHASRHAFTLTGWLPGFRAAMHLNWWAHMSITPPTASQCQIKSNILWQPSSRTSPIHGHTTKITRPSPFSRQVQTLFASAPKSKQSACTAQHSMPCKDGTSTVCNQIACRQGNAEGSDTIACAPWCSAARQPSAPQIPQASGSPQSQTHHLQGVARAGAGCNVAACAI
jgi:hypothetical protein